MMCLQQPELTVSKIAEFIGHSLSAAQISNIVRRTSFDVMKQDSSVNYSWWDELGMRLPSESQFMRKGAASDLTSSLLTSSSVILFLCNLQNDITTVYL